MELSILPECYLDTNLIETILPPIKGYNHQILTEWLFYLKQNTYNVDLQQLTKITNNILCQFFKNPL